MQQIIDYVEVMFKNLPQTHTVLQAKEQILDSMLSKYEAYIQNNMTESEAIGRVIGEFGNVEDLMEGLGIHSDEQLIDSNRLQAFLNFIPRFAFSIALAVCILGLAFSLLVRDQTINAFIILMFIAAFIALALFIVFGFKMHQFQDIMDTHTKLTLGDHQKVSQIKKDYNTRFIITLLLAFALMISILPILIIYGDVPNILSAAVVLFSISMFILLFGAIPYGLYESLLEQKQTHNPEHASAIIMPLAVFAYLLIGFLFNGWHPWWIIIPICGVISGFLDSQISSSK